VRLHVYVPDVDKLVAKATKELKKRAEKAARGE